VVEQLFGFEAKALMHFMILEHDVANGFKDRWRGREENLPLATFDVHLQEIQVIESLLLKEIRECATRNGNCRTAITIGYACDQSMIRGLAETAHNSFSTFPGQRPLQKKDAVLEEVGADVLLQELECLGKRLETDNSGGRQLASRPQCKRTNISACVDYGRTVGWNAIASGNEDLPKDFDLIRAGCL
jgi:hypothetical protein